ncbi:MAG: DUF998 domain-containing protein [Dehalococcoidia bacterium]|nr:DUF998 domain-containing protein [Dehalococcoidia bacterium]
MGCHAHSPSWTWHGRSWSLSVSPRDVHFYSATLVFVFGGLSGIVAARVQHGVFRYISAAMGAVVLVSVAVSLWDEATPMYRVLGSGGIERWIVYPILLWLVAYGAYLLGVTAKQHSED